MKPDTSSPEAFGQQAKAILGTNYWGLKNVITGLQDIFTPGARLVNMSSHLGHLSMINGEAKQSLHLREVLANIDLSEKNLDNLTNQFETFAGQGGWVAAGWPNCAYTVSKANLSPS